MHILHKLQRLGVGKGNVIIKTSQAEVNKPIPWLDSFDVQKNEQIFFKKEGKEI